MTPSELKANILSEEIKAMSKYPKYQIQKYTLWTYDLWGNPRDGWEVNDRYKQGTITLKVKASVFNEGTNHEFVTYIPTDAQINRAIGCRGVVWEGEAEYTLYGETKSGKPVAELERIREE